jgi:hypothetical protein
MCFTLHQVGFFNCNDFTRDPVSSNYWWLSITTLSLCMIKVLWFQGLSRYPQSWNQKNPISLSGV